MMDAGTFKKAVEKATFESSVSELIISSDGTTGTISVAGSANDRIGHIEFPFPLEGEWGIGEPAKLIKSLGKIDGELKIEEKNNMFILKGGKKRYKFPLLGDLCGVRNKSPYTPSRRGLELCFDERKAALATVKFVPASIKELKKAIKSEDVYKEEAIVMFDTGMEIFGKDVTDFSAGDTIEGTLQSESEEIVKGTYTGLNNVVDVLGNEDVTIYTAHDSLFYVEDNDGDVKAIYVVLPIIRSNT